MHNYRRNKSVLIKIDLKINHFSLLQLRLRLLVFLEIEHLITKIRETKFDEIN